MSFDSSTQMKKLRKMIVCEGLEISEENAYDAVFSEVTCLQFTDCNSSIKRLLHISLLEDVSKASCLQKNILTKKSMVGQCFNKVEQASNVDNFIK